MANSIIEKIKRWGGLVSSIILIIIIILGVNRFYQYQELLALETLQGCWHIRDNVFLIFDDNTMQVLEATMGDNNQIKSTRLHSDTSITYKYKRWNSLKLHKFKAHRCYIKRSNSDPIVGVSNSQIITFDLYPVLGTAIIIENEKEIARITKDNAMSIRYLS